MLHDRFDRVVDWRQSADFGLILTPIECPDGIAQAGAFYAFVDEGCWAIYGGFAQDLYPVETGFGGVDAAEAALIRCGILSRLSTERLVC